MLMLVRLWRFCRSLRFDLLTGCKHTVVISKESGITKVCVLSHFSFFSFFFLQSGKESAEATAQHTAQCTHQTDNK